VTLGEDVAAYTPQRHHLLEVQSRISATAREGSPASARITGTSTAISRLSSGEAVAVRVELYVTQYHATAAGHISIDGSPFFSRTWEA
jgi:hypothetical protein